jgi:hypothetical protein
MPLLRFLTDHVEHRLHGPAQEAGGYEDQGSRDVGVESPLHLVTNFKAHFAQQLPRHRDRAALLQRVRPVEDVDGKIHVLILEKS